VNLYLMRARDRIAPGRHPMLSDHDVHKVMEATRGLHGEDTLTVQQRADRRAAEHQHKQTQQRLIREGLDRVGGRLETDAFQEARREAQGRSSLTLGLRYSARLSAVPS
jgi:hypothetical protein